MALADNPAYNKGRLYYDRGDMRIEMSPVGYSHCQDNGVVYYILVLYATIENIRIKGVVNTSLRRNGNGRAPSAALSARFSQNLLSILGTGLFHFTRSPSPVPRQSRGNEGCGYKNQAPAPRVTPPPLRRGYSAC
ncbi:MAG: hypothetical protein EBE86_032600 [Hormoscilla sp. GUM202]|nr:hypothetical protein [Hormoscilla sp. GUM202]